MEWEGVMDPTAWRSSTDPQRRVETTELNQWASPGGPEKALAFLFSPVPEIQAAWEDLGLMGRRGVRFTRVVEGVGVVILEVAAKRSGEESERSATDLYMDEPWTTT